MVGCGGSHLESQHSGHKMISDFKSRLVYILNYKPAETT
jgi:hypothetical protein